MPLSAGIRLGPYEIVGPIGAGGMGEVYRARDPRLGRDVAIKVSKQQFTERFEREARAVAALNHPHICQIYDVGPDYIVMELVDGVPLKGPLPVQKAIDYAGQILDALDAAHRKGITHRDLKPANILVTKQGIKLLDFGLAKQSSVLTESDATGITVNGQILGTLQYMSPEQLQGKEADARSDLFSFGCVLYELLSGKQAFAGSSNASVIAAILEREPAPLETTPPLDRVIRTCLAKDPEQRFQNALDLKRDLKWAMDQQPSTGTSRRVWWVVAAALALGIGAGAVFTYFRQPTTLQPGPLRLSLTVPEGARFISIQNGSGGMALSPDGSSAAYVLEVGGKRAVWLHQLAGSARLLPGTEGAAHPFWSPDGKSLGFLAAGKLKRIEIAGGSAQVVCDVVNAAGPTWGTDGFITFSDGGLSRVSSAGGTATSLTRLDPASGEISHLWPQMLPGGRLLYFVIADKPEKTGLYAASLAKPLDRVLVLVSDSVPIFVPTGYLVWARGTKLVAQHFDPVTLKLSGEPESLADSIGRRGYPHLSVSQTGLLLYYDTAGGTQLTWLDRAGKFVGRAADPDDLYQTRLSPDGRRTASIRLTERNVEFNIWLRDWERQVSTRLTFTPGSHSFPVWSPDGLALLYSAGTPLNLYRIGTSGAGHEVRLTQSPNLQAASDWSRDGNLVLYAERTPETKIDLWIFPLSDANPKPRPYLRTPFNETWGRFSPESNPRWVAYQSDETGRYEIYIRAFPEPGAKFQISTGGGQYPQWGQGGRELYYLSPGNELLAVSLKLGAGSVEPSAPHALFALPPLGYVNDSPYEADPNGQRFLILAAPDKPAQLNLIVNWPALLKKGSSGQ